MAFIETEGLVLKSFNLNDADKIVVFLTREHGVIRGVAKGAKRLKSKFGSGLEPFSLVKLSYAHKEVLELVSIKDTELIKSNFAAASNPEFIRKFAYLANLLIAISPPHDPNETLYRMAIACLETAALNAASIDSTGVYFEFWLLQLAGYLPDWSKCDGCSRSLTDNENTFLLPNFHVVCGQCRRSGIGRTLDAGTRATISEARRASPTNFASIMVGRENDIVQASTILKRIFSEYIGKEIVGESASGIRT